MGRSSPSACLWKEELKIAMAKKQLVLVVEDEQWAREFLKELLEAEGYRVDTAADGSAAAVKIETGAYDLVISDLKMQGYDGIEVLKLAKAQSYDPEVLLITAYGSVESAVEAIKLGAFDYLSKPMDSKRVMLTVQQALEKRRLKNEVAHLRGQVEEKYGRKNIITTSVQMRKVLELVDLVARTDSSVLIEGESGTGKELVARAIHFGGPRRNRPFIAVNCGALPEPLLESELFGHVKGAFTGAVRDKKGLFEEADGGSLLLDEVGDMPLSLQVKLLRVLQDGEVRKVGSNTSMNVDVRIISSTNRNLASLIKEGTFREDLFYRLRVVPLVIPPLRERKEEITPLVNHFLNRYNLKLKKEVKGFTPQSIEMLLSYDWPGNIRELENLVEGAIALSTSSLITPLEMAPILYLEEKDSEDVEANNKDLSLSRMHEKVEREYVLKALEKHRWNQGEAAQDLGIGRTSLWRKMEKYDLRKLSFRQ